MGGAWEHFIDGLCLYVENYMLKRFPVKLGKAAVQPSEEVDYEIENAETLIHRYWREDLVRSTNINELPDVLKAAAVDYLPRFKKRYPRYANDDSLKIKDQ